jgi:hypothetical protein
MVQMVANGWRRRPPPTAPSHRASNIAKVASATTVTVAIPATAAIGNELLVFLVISGARTLTGYSGPTLTTIASSVTGDARPNVYLAKRTIGSGDAGTNMTFTQDAANSMLVVAAVYQDVGGYSIAPQVYPCLQTVEPANSRPSRCATIKPGPDDLIVGFTGAHSYVSTNANAAQLATAPSGATIRQTDSTPTTGLVVPFGIGLFDAPSHDYRYEWVAFNQACNFQSVILALHPVGGSPAQREKAPTTLAGKPLFCYSNSMGAYVRRAETNWGYNSMRPWPNRVAAVLGTELTTSKNLAMVGSRSQDICTAAYGTDTYSTQSTLGDPQTIDRAVTWDSIRVTDSLIVTDLLGNDAIHGTANAQDFTSASNAVKALLHLLRSANVKGAGDASIAYSAGWSTASSTGYQGGTAKLATVPGETVTITAALDAIDVVLVGQDDSRFTTGSTFSITVDGTPYATGTVSNQAASTGWGNDYGFCQLVIPITGMGAGTHTIVITHTGSSGNRLLFNCWMTPASTPPWIVTNFIEHITDATLTTLGVTRAQLDNFNALLAPIAAGFTDHKVLVYDSWASGVFDNADTAPSPPTLNPGMISTDGVHPNEIGHAFYAHEILRLLNEKVA